MKKLFLLLTLVLAMATNALAALESRWDCGEWGTLTMYQSGTEIEGVYDYHQGGSITGTLDPARNIITGYWQEVLYEADDYCGPGNGYEGHLEFKVAAIGDNYLIKGDYSDCVGTMPDWQNGNWNCQMISGEFDLDGLDGIDEPVVEFMQIELFAQDTDLYPGDTVKVDAVISGNGTGDIIVILEHLGYFYSYGNCLVGLVPVGFTDEISVKPSDPITMTVMDYVIPTDAIFADISSTTLWAYVRDNTETRDLISNVATIDFQLFFN